MADPKQTVHTPSAMPANDTQSLARRIAEKIECAGGYSDAGFDVDGAERIIAAEMEERERKVQELMETADTVLRSTVMKSWDAGECISNDWKLDDLRDALKALRSGSATQEKGGEE